MSDFLLGDFISMGTGSVFSKHSISGADPTTATSRSGATMAREASSPLGLSGSGVGSALRPGCRCRLPTRPLVTGSAAEDNWNGRCRSLRCKRRGAAAERSDQPHLALNQIGGQRR
jgi:hypothetical protein